MIHPKSLSLLAFCASMVLADWTRASDLTIRVEAGQYARKETPVRFDAPAIRFDAQILKALDSGPRAAEVIQLEPFEFDPPPDARQVASNAQLERIDGDKVRVTLFLRAMAAGTRARLRIGDRMGFPRERLAFAEATPGAIELKYGDRTVFRYNAAPVSSPKYKEIQIRDAYIHPAYSPSGALITGDFSSSHPHHRGFFLAYERTKTGDLTPDFWNIHAGTGKIHADGLDKPVVGPLTARFSAKHRWEAIDKKARTSVDVLRERWDVETYAIPGAPYWLFDITSTQQAVDRPLELLPYRYGGMAYRGPEPFVKGKLDVLTSQGLDRKTGDQKLAQWVDLTGPVTDGSDKYAGAMIADHPSNPNYPTAARIHPTTLPFFCYVPAHDKPLTIAVDTPTVFRYRVLIHDGKPDKALDDRVARDFAEPPTVVVN